MTENSNTSDRLRSEYEKDGGTGGVFSKKAVDYSAARPDYPAQLYETLAAVCKLSADSVVADVGAGTGLLTQGLLQRDYHVIAVEPNEAMRQACDRNCGTFPRYRSVAGSAESMPLASSSVDLITAAQAFHWFKVAQARVECLRVLKRQGSVALIWNDRVLDDPLQVALDAIFAEYGGTKRAALAAHEKRNNLAEFFGTTKPSEYSWPHEQRLDEEGLVSLVLSRSYMPVRESDAGNEVAAKVRAVFAAFAKDGVVVLRYTTVAKVGRVAL
jgi:ubiquinone/menaquinone biosynthesis C-methylase UbiE